MPPAIALRESSSANRIHSISGGYLCRVTTLPAPERESSRSGQTIERDKPPRRHKSTGKQTEQALKSQLERDQSFCGAASSGESGRAGWVSARLCKHLIFAQTDEMFATMPRCGDALPAARHLRGKPEAVALNLTAFAKPIVGRSGAR